MKLQSILFLLFLISFNSFASDSLHYVRTIPVNAHLLSTDPLGNIYLVKDNNTVLKLNSKGDSIGIFNEIKKGKVTQIDATNPLRTLLFFAEYNQIVVLNNMLTQKNVMRLNMIGLNNVAAIANSADGNIWLYDPSFGSLLKIDEQMDVIQTADLRNLYQNPTAPTAMVEHERSLYIADTTDGIRKFDLFGFYNTTFPFKVSNLQFFTTSMVYFASPYLYSYNMQSFSEQKILLPQPEAIVSVRIERNNVYILRSSSLEIYRLNDN